MKFINVLKNYLIETCNYEYIGLKYIYFYPEQIMYTVFIDYDYSGAEIKNYIFKIIKKSHKLNSCDLIDFIYDMFYVNPLLIDFSKSYQRINLKYKISMKNYVKYDVYLDFSYGFLKTQYDIFCDNNWKTRLLLDKEKYYNKLPIESRKKFKELINEKI